MIFKYILNELYSSWSIDNGLVRSNIGMERHTLKGCQGNQSGAYVFGLRTVRMNRKFLIHEMFRDWNVLVSGERWKSQGQHQVPCFKTLKHSTERDQFCYIHRRNSVLNLHKLTCAPNIWMERGILIKVVISGEFQDGGRSVVTHSMLGIFGILEDIKWFL